MPTNVVSMDNMRKHMTNAEKSARAQAENQIERKGKVRLIEPKAVKEDPKAHVYWRNTKKRLAGIKMLDDVDSDMLGIYCQLNARRDGALSHEIFMKTTELLSLERLIVQYAEKLGLTPGGRARLAKKAAEKPKENKFSKFQK
jgi:phage terminase small subunit